MEIYPPNANPPPPRNMAFFRDRQPSSPNTSLYKGHDFLGGGGPCFTPFMLCNTKVDARAQNLQTPLMWAMTRGHVQVTPRRKWVICCFWCLGITVIISIINLNPFCRDQIWCKCIMQIYGSFEGFPMNSVVSWFVVVIVVIYHPYAKYRTVLMWLLQPFGS